MTHLHASFNLFHFGTDAQTFSVWKSQQEQLEGLCYGYVLVNAVLNDYFSSYGMNRTLSKKVITP